MNEVVDLEMFRPILEEQLEDGKSPGSSRPEKDSLLKLKMCLLQNLHKRRDEETEFQMLERTSFLRFLGLSVSDKVPDAQTLWLLHERLGAGKSRNCQLEYGLTSKS